MNKGITLLILGVVACAMGIVLFSHMQGEPEGTTAKDHVSDVPPSPRGNATASKDLVDIVPPISSTSERAPVTTTPQGRLVEERPDKTSATATQTEQVPSPAQRPTTPQPAASAKEPEKPARQSQEPTTTQRPETVDSPSAKKETPPAEAAAAERLKMPETPPAKTSGMPSLVPVDTLSATPEKKQPEATAPTKKEATAPSQASTPKTKAGSAEKATPAPKSDVTPGTAGNHRMTAVTARIVGSKVHVRLQADNAFSYKTMLLPGPDRLVIDLPGAWQNVKAPDVPSNRLLEKVRVGTQPAGPRMVLDLKLTPRSYEVIKISDSVIEFIVE